MCLITLAGYVPFRLGDSDTSAAILKGALVMFHGTSWSCFLLNCILHSILAPKLVYWFSSLKCFELSWNWGPTPTAYMKNTSKAVFWTIKGKINTKSKRCAWSNNNLGPNSYKNFYTIFNHTLVLIKEMQMLLYGQFRCLSECLWGQGLVYKRL